MVDISSTKRLERNARNFRRPLVYRLNDLMGMKSQSEEDEMGEKSFLWMAEPGDTVGYVSTFVTLME